MSPVDVRIASALTAAGRLVSLEVEGIFDAEIANEDTMRREAEFKERYDEMPPTANLSTMIDSLRQGLPASEDALLAILGIRDLLPGDTALTDICKAIR